jgi:predicted RND superfamily exporter protein
MSLLKVPLTIISDVIPVILIAIGTAPTIHILSKYDEDKSRYGATDDKAKEAFSEVGWRVILTSLTIVFGFVSFIFGSYLTMIKEFGIFTSIGVMLMLIVSVMFVPAVLSFVKVRDDKPGDRQKKGGKLITRGMNIIGDFVFKNEKAIIIGSLLIFVVGIAFIPKIVRKVDIVDFFKPNHKVHDTERIIKDNFGGSRPIQVLVNGDMQDPYVLKEMRLLSKYLNYLPNVSNAQSVAALVAQMNGVMDKNDVIPDSRDKVTNLWFFLDGQEIMPQLVDSDKQNGLVQALFKNMDLKSMNDNLKQIDDYIKNTPNELVVVEKKALKGSDRDIAYSCGIKSVAQSIIWDAGNRDLSQHKDPEGLEDALKNCKNDPAKMSAAALAMFPQELAANERFVKDVQNDIAELKQENMALPKTIYNAMSAGKPAPLEEVSFKMDYTGIPLIYQHLDQSLLKSQVESLLYAVVFIYILLLFQLKSFVGAFFGLSPILLIISVMFGVMGLTGIPLDVATVLAASIALGIGIDYSIHFSVRFRNNYKEIPDHLQALDATLDTTGRAIVINVLAVTMGFITLIFAKLVPLNRFGILVAITMIGSGIGALTLLPSLFLVTKGKFIGSLTRIKNKMKEMNKK